MFWVCVSVTLLLLIGFVLVWVHISRRRTRSCPMKISPASTCVPNNQEIRCETGLKAQQRCGGHIECVPAKPEVPSDFASMNENTVRILNSTSQDPLNVFLEIENLNNNTLTKPKNNWEIQSANSKCSLSAPQYYYTKDFGLKDDQKPRYDPNAVGSATWQILTLPKGEQCDLTIPDFDKGQAWSVRPLRMCDNTFCGTDATYGSPIIIECGENMVCDMSAVDGVNFLCHMTFTNISDDVTVIDFKKNPCPSENKYGCLTPAKDGFFLQGVGWESKPCPAGTCNLQGKSKEWCDNVNFGQCSTSDSTWSSTGQTGGGPPSCRLYSSATTYCFSHNDAPSSVTLDQRKKLRLEYRDLSQEQTL